MSQETCLLAKCRPFFHRLRQVWFSGWLALLEAKFQKQPALNYCGTDYCASFHQLILNFFGGTHWRATNHLGHKAISSAARNPWLAIPFSVLENILILLFRDCIMHRCSDNVHLFCNLTYRQFLIGKGYDFNPFLRPEKLFLPIFLHL